MLLDDNTTKIIRTLDWRYTNLNMLFHPKCSISFLYLKFIVEIEEAMHFVATPVSEL